MVKSTAATAEEYLAELPPGRREVVAAVRTARRHRPARGQHSSRGVHRTVRSQQAAVRDVHWHIGVPNRGRLGALARVSPVERPPIAGWNGS